MLTDKERYITEAHRHGLPREQLEFYLRIGYIANPKQLEFHGAAAKADNGRFPREIALGGARGPGKSHGSFAQLVWDCMRHGNIKALYLRKVGGAATEQLEDLRIKLLSAVEHTAIKSPTTIRFPNGSTIRVGHFQADKDIDKYLGIEYDVIAIEEATQLTLHKVNLLLGSLRSVKPEWRPRVYFTTNPGGVGHSWFKRRFVYPFRKKQQTASYFIPATAVDNPLLDADYIAYLNSLTGVLGRMWRDGDWDALAGGYFTNFDYKTHVVTPDEIPLITADSLTWASLDHGFKHYTVNYFHTMYDGDIYTFGEHALQKALVEENANGIKEQADLWGFNLNQLSAHVAGHDVFQRRGRTNTTGEEVTIAQQYLAEGIDLEHATIDRLNGAAEMLRRLGNQERGIAPSWFVSNTCTGLIERLPLLEHDPKRAEDVKKVDANEQGDGGDDHYDAARYGLMWRPKTAVAVPNNSNIRTHINLY